MSVASVRNTPSTCGREAPMARKTPISRSRSMTRALNEKSTPRDRNEDSDARRTEVTAKVSSKMSKTRCRSAALSYSGELTLASKPFAKRIADGSSQRGSRSLRARECTLLFTPIPIEQGSRHQDCPAIAREIPVDSANREFLNTCRSWQCNFLLGRHSKSGRETFRNRHASARLKFLFSAVAFQKIQFSRGPCR